MGITRTREVTVADAWGNNDGGVTLEVGEGRTELTPAEAHEFGQQVIAAAFEAEKTTRERDVRPLTNEPPC